MSQLLGDRPAGARFQFGASGNWFSQQGSTNSYLVSVTAEAL